MTTRITPEQLDQMVRRGAKIISDSGPARLPGGRTTAKTGTGKASGVETQPRGSALDLPRPSRPEPIRIDSRCMPAIETICGVILERTATEPAYQSKLEARFSHRLIAEAPKVWAYELFTFRLAARTWYTPDFCQIRDGRIVFYETKGYLWEKDSVKLKLFARLYPFPLVLVRWERGQWVEKVVPAD